MINRWPFDFCMQLETIEESIEFIRTRPKPLAIYGFTNIEKLQKKMICETSSGSITFNDAIIQVTFFFG